MIIMALTFTSLIAYADREEIRESTDTKSYTRVKRPKPPADVDNTSIEGKQRKSREALKADYMKLMEMVRATKGEIAILNETVKSEHIEAKTHIKALLSDRDKVSIEDLKELRALLDELNKSRRRLRDTSHKIRLKIGEIRVARENKNFAEVMKHFKELLRLHDNKINDLNHLKGILIRIQGI